MNSIDKTSFSGNLDPHLENRVDQETEEWQGHTQSTQELYANKESSQGETIFGTADSDDDDDDDGDIYLSRKVRRPTSKRLMSDGEDSDDEPDLVGGNEEENKSQSSINLQVSDDGDKSDDEPMRLFRSDESDNAGTSNNPDAAEKSNSSDEESGSSSSEDEDGAPIRLFRSTDPSERDGTAETEEQAVLRYSKASKSAAKSSSQDLINLKSETQRIIRESNLNLPYHVPEKLSLAEFMAKRKECGQKSTKQVTTRRERIIAILNKQGRSLPTLDVQNKPARKPALIDIKDAEEEKGFSMKTGKYDESVSSDTRSLSQVENKSEVGSKDILFANCSKFQALKQRLQVKMKIKREAERKRKEEMRRFDNEDFADDEEDDAEMTDADDEAETKSESELSVGELDNCEATDDEPDANELKENSESATKDNQQVVDDDHAVLDNEEIINKKSLSSSIIVDDCSKKSFASIPPPESFGVGGKVFFSSPKPVNEKSGTASFFDKSNISGKSAKSPASTISLNNDGNIKNNVASEKSFKKSLMFKEAKSKSYLFSESDLDICTEAFPGTGETIPEQRKKNLEKRQSVISNTFNGFVEKNGEMAMSSVLDVKQEAEAPVKEKPQPDEVGEPKNYFKLAKEQESDNDDDDKPIVIRRSKTKHQKIKFEGSDKQETSSGIKHNLANFLEDEAELSGEDDGDDEGENEGEDNDYYEEEENDEVLPDEEQIHHQVNKAHLKQMLDEDDRDVERLKDAFIDDDPTVNRVRRNRWKNVDLSQFTNDLLADAVDDENEGADLIEQESQWRKMRLEREQFLASMEPSNEDLLGADSQVFQLGKSAIDSSRSRFDSNLSASNSASSSRRRESFLSRGSVVLAKYAQLPDINPVKSAVNSDKMIFKPKTKGQKRSSQPIASGSGVASKRSRDISSLDENSNSVFDLFERR